MEPNDVDVDRLADKVRGAVVVDLDAYRKAGASAPSVGETARSPIRQVVVWALGALLIFLALRYIRR